MRIGFIGLGHMGGHMSRNLMEAGFDLAVHDLVPEAAAGLLQRGARWFDSAPALAREVDVLITMLPGPRQIESVMLHGGTAAALRPGGTWVDMSTSTPEAARRVAEIALDPHGVARMDAPVSGMAKGADSGMLQIFVGAERQLFERHLPVLRAMGDPDRILHVGPVGSGYTVKLMVNLLWFSHLVATSEVLTMGVKAGVDLQVLRGALVASPARSHFVENDIECVLKGDYDESFAMALACKDLGLAVDLGRDVGVPVEVSGLVEQIYRRGMAQYGPQAGEMIPVKLYEDLAGIALRAPLQPAGAS